MPTKPRPRRVTFDACYAEWNGSELTLGNAAVERRWRAENGLLYAVSLRDLTSGCEWLAEPSGRPAPCPERALPDERRQVRFSAAEKKDMPVEAPSLHVRLRASGKTAALVYHFQIYPHAPAICCRLTTEWKTDAPGPDAGAASETAEVGPSKPNPEEGDGQEALRLAPQHLRLTQVVLVDGTDSHNELVFENEWLLHTAETSLALQGNLFVFENTLTRAGLVFLKQAPLPHARPIRAERDLVVRGRNRDVALYGHGAGPDGGEGYPWAVLVYANGEAGRTAALQAYQRQVRTFDPDRDGLFLSNTWGDRSQDSRINEPFMRKGIEAGAPMGVDVVQIDDGWQRGRSANSALGGGAREGFWNLDPDFWAPHPERFPNGFADLVADARKRGMRFGLWFWPDTADDLENWSRDADVLLDYHRNSGIDYFKIDGVKVLSKTAERNLRRLLDRVLIASQGRVVFDLDVTAGVRPGYFGLMHVGPLFIENRYTDAHRYWPHQTLRNLWKLARYVDPLRLRMEFLNNARNAHLYPDDPLAPGAHAPAYLFATTLVANPLGWFEISNLPQAYRDAVASLAQTWRDHRTRLFRGAILPIGAPPDGTAWTGFASVGVSGRTGYLLLFREYNDRPVWTAELPVFTEGAFHTEVLAGEGAVRLSGGRLEAEIPDPRSFLFVRVEAG